MKLLALVFALAFALSLSGDIQVGDIYVQGQPDRAYALVLEGHAINLQDWPGAVNGSLVLEAALGERVEIAVSVPPGAEPHTFHMHGHPWFAPAVGRVVDTWLLKPGETHAFTIVAGGVDQHAGDWMFHCHIGTHTAQGMWGVFRVYPFKTSVVPAPGGLTVTVDRLGTPLDDATLALTVDGAPLPAHVEALGGGRYQMHAQLPATGALAITAHSAAWGESVGRLALGGGAPLPVALPGHAH